MGRGAGPVGRARSGHLKNALGKWPGGGGQRFFDPFHALFDDGAQRLKSGKTKPLTTNGKMG